MSVKILGIDFRQDAHDLPASLDQAGLVVVPSGPGLACDLTSNDAYRRALAGADWVIPDSGFMALVWNVLHVAAAEKQIKRYSGLKLLREVLPKAEVQAHGASFWVMPSLEEQDRNLSWLRKNGFPSISADNCYVAPIYRHAADGTIEDFELIAKLDERRPQYIFLNVGGGTQEQLGWFLKSRLPYRPAILCTGAAIAFLAGGQAAIPPWADRFYLGWLLRILQDPAKFGRRYWASIGLVGLICRYRDRSPMN